ncbi:MAG: hypothetical protein ACI4ET_12725 [Bilifractor sp.]
MNDTYLTYDEYKNYGGTLAEDDFRLAEFQARKSIDYITDNRVQPMKVVPESVKLCIMTLIKVQQKYGADALAGDEALVNSFNTDGYSESYGSAADQIAAARKAMNTKIREMLYGEKDDLGIPLLYRGLDT